MANCRKQPRSFKDCASPRLASLFDSNVVAVEAAPKIVDSELFDEELAHVKRSVAKRKAEFGTSRVLARRALGQIGVEAGALMPSKDRTPSWPKGVVGSITHTDDFCAVVVADSESVRSIGIDAEADTPLKPELVEMVCTPGEKRWLDAQDENRRGLLAKLIFSAKEAFYKCQYPLTKTFLDFLDVELTFDLETETFTARMLKQVNSWCASNENATGRFKIEDGLIVTTMTV
ncbi:MAG: 4'-phosphopantetheinyl transferase superfamily protein [Myxococcota bacterium]